MYVCMYACMYVCIFYGQVVVWLQKKNRVSVTVSCFSLPFSCDVAFSTFSSAATQLHPPSANGAGNWVSNNSLITGNNITSSSIVSRISQTFQFQTTMLKFSALHLLLLLPRWHHVVLHLVRILALALGKTSTTRHSVGLASSLSPWNLTFASLRLQQKSHWAGQSHQSLKWIHPWDFLEWIILLSKNKLGHFRNTRKVP